MKASLMVAVMMLMAELCGITIYVNVKDTVKRSLLACLGLGFMYAIVIADILPDATENFKLGYLICILGILCMYLISRKSSRIGTYSTIVGMGFHNICEGIILSALTAISPILIVGLVMHKLPEGMVSFSLLENIKSKLKYVLAVGISLLIPLGSIIFIPENVSKPIIGLAAGAILFTVTSSFRTILSKKNSEYLYSKIATMAFIGAIIGGVSCLIV